MTPGVRDDERIDSFFLFLLWAKPKKKPFLETREGVFVHLPTYLEGG